MRPLCARRLDSVHLQRQRGQKRHPFLLSGRGAVDTNKSPLPLPPRCVGVMSGMSWVPLSPGALFLVTHHQAFSAAHSASYPLLHANTHTAIHEHLYARSSTPPGLCVPWSLTLNRPPRLNTTDRRASGHQVQQPKSCMAAQWGKYSQLFSPVFFPHALCLTGERNKTMVWVFWTLNAYSALSVGLNTLPSSPHYCDQCKKKP